MKTYSVTIPIAGHAFLMIEAESESAAIDAGMEKIALKDISEFEPLKSFNEGNVCYCPTPWEAVAEEEK